jgi:hypothetical protein
MTPCTGLMISCMNSLRGVVVATTSMATVRLRLVPLYTGEVANADPADFFV